MAAPHVADWLPEVDRALRNVQVEVLQDDGFGVSPEQVFLMKAEDTTQAYQRWDGKPTVPLPGRGEVLFCQVLLKDQDNPEGVFARSAIIVAVKKLRRWVIDPPLQRQVDGTGEVVNKNHYIEISVMQQHGNDINMMDCYEALYDEKYLYIITLCAQEGSLDQHVNVDPPTFDVPAVVTHLVHNLQRMKQFRLVHRDLRPNNILCLGPWFPFIDFAMTRRADVHDGVTLDIESTGSPETQGYISPEIYNNRSFNYKADVWALGCILWNLLTGLELYTLPMATNRSYGYFILAEGLTNETFGEKQLQHLLQHNPFDELVPRLQAVQTLPRIARNLLATLLQANPVDRPTLAEILEHEFLQ